VSDYDYIVIGAGSAGCAIASRLSEDPSAGVLLLEAGGSNDDERIAVPHRAWELWTTPFDWGYTTAPQAAALNRSIYWPRGKVLGGSSCLNAMIYVRGTPADYDHWAYLGNAGWDYDSVLPYFKKSEDYHGGRSRHHGTGGPLSVSRNTAPNPLTVAFIEAAVGAGHPINHDFSGDELLGVGYTDTTTTPDGRRCCAVEAFLKAARNRRNLTVHTGAHSRRLVIENGCCRGVVYERGGQLDMARATREVVVSAGAIGSPRLLLLSGIGPADDLKKLGIGVNADLPGVGANLHDHLLTFVIHEASREIPAPRHNILEAHLFAKSDPQLAGPDHQPLFMCSAAAADAGNSAERLRDRARHHPAGVSRRTETHRRRSGRAAASRSALSERAGRSQRPRALARSVDRNHGKSRARQMAQALGMAAGEDPGGARAMGAGDLRNVPPSGWHL
jgi:choline dehydrogenase